LRLLLLTATTDNISVTTSAAADVDIHVSYVDASQAAPPVVQGDTMGRQNTTMTTATTTDIVASPAASETRNIKTIHIRNTHATTATDVTVNYDQNGTLYELYKTSLLSGEMCEYVEGVGFFKLATGLEAVQWVRKSATQTFAATAFADVTGMGFAVAAGGRYEIEYDITWRSATATVGVGLALNGPASPTSVQGTVLIMGVRGAATAGAFLGAGFVAYDTPNISTIAVEATGTDYMARLSAIVENGSTAGTVIPRWRSETATSTTVEPGSFGTCKRIG
jgi:hypothetical protein